MAPSHGEEREEPVLLERSSRITRGKRMTKLLDEEIEEDEQFWNQDALKEEENDANYEEEVEVADVFDSDFEEDEPEPDEEVENDADDRVQRKKRLTFPGKPVTKKKNKKKVLSKLESASKDESSHKEQSNLPEHHDIPDDIEGERIVRKSTRTSVIVRQAERDAIRAALQATMKPIKRRKEGEEKRMTQEEMLLEAAQTEIMNLRNLERVLAREEEVKKRAVVHKAVYSGPQIRYSSRNGQSYLEFSKGLSFRSEIGTTLVPYPQKAVCPVTGLPANFSEENNRVKGESKDMGLASPATQRSSLPSSPLQRLSTFKDTTSLPPITTSTPIPNLPSSSSPLHSFSSDPIFSAFLSPDFDSARFSSQALSSGSAAARAEKLQDGIHLLEKQLRSEVLSRHDDLLSQLSSLKDVESALSVVRSGISTIQSSVRRVRQEIADPHRQIRLKTVQLSNVHHTAELLQFTVRVLRLSKKLRDLMAVAASEPEKLDLSKAAQLHHEILGLCEENSLQGIAVVDEEMSWILETGNRLRSEAMKVLERGMEGLNQAEVGSGLQVFYNLGELRSTVDALINKYKSQGVKSVGAALDMKAISASSGHFGPGGIQRSGMPQIGGGAKARELLWQRMNGCMDQMHSIVVAVWQLQRVLSKKRDPFTHVLLLDEVMQDGDQILTDRVWEALVKSFGSQMKSAFSASSFVKETFTVGYPKLISTIENLLERISRDTDVKGVLPAISSEGKDQMVAAIDIFQTAFLALCLGRLSDLVDSVFPVSNRGSVPSKDQISRIALRIQEEIEAVKLDGHLTLLVLHEINKVLLLLAERAEYQISTGPEARQVIGPATASQLKNFTLYQHLQETHNRISSTMSGLPTVASDVLSPSLGAIYGVACDSVTSLFQAMLDRLEACILQIHEQNFGVHGMDAARDNNTSPYMEELQKCVLHFRSEFLSRLLPSFSTHAISKGTETICTRLVRRLASRVLIFFIRHAALVRPLSESGKLRMARDMAELELAVGQNLFPVEQLGAPYRALRAFRPVIFLETSQLGASPLLQDLPPSVILHHLYSRGPEELQLPLQRNKLTPLQYSLWLDSQGEDQIWKGIKATLDDYAAKVRARGDKEFCSAYPLMLQLGSLFTENALVSKKS